MITPKLLLRNADQYSSEAAFSFKDVNNQWQQQVKLRKIREFLEGGDRVKVSLRFRGREMAHQRLGLEMLT